jgi:hypothetical protein
MFAMLAHVDPVRGSALNEQELWREMVRCSGGRIVEERGVLLVSGPSAYLRVAIRTDPLVDGPAVVASATAFFAGEPVSTAEPASRRRWAVPHPWSTPDRVRSPPHEPARLRGCRRRGCAGRSTGGADPPRARPRGATCTAI